MSSFFKLPGRFTTNSKTQPTSSGSMFVCSPHINHTPRPIQQPKSTSYTPTLDVDVRESSILEIDKIIRKNLLQAPKDDKGVGLALYDIRVDSILGELSKYQNNQPRSFVVGQMKKPDKKVDEISRRYYSVAQLYITLHGISKISSVMVCEWCYGTSFTISFDDESIYVCDGCFGERELLDDNPSFKDTDRVNMASKYTYSESGHFEDEIKKFQGIQNHDPVKIGSVVDILKTQMELHGLIAEPHKKNSITKDEMYAFLAEQGLSSHYGDLNLLYSMITKIPCPDLSNITELLYEDFEILNKTLNKIQDENRVNSLTVGHILYKLLQKHNFPCRKTDFYILKTQSKEDEHDEKMKEAWEILGWKWTPTY